MTVCRRRSPGRFALALLFLIVGLALLSSCGSENAGGEEQPLPDFAGMLLNTPLEKPSFTLPDTSGRRFDFAKETEGYVTFLYFGYTYCPDICPTQMVFLSGAMKEVPEEVRDRIKVVFVTADPARDTAERLRQWLDNFDTAIAGLLPINQERVNDISLRALGPLWAPLSNEALPEGGYAVTHPAMLIAYTTDNLAHVIYPFGVTRDVLEKDLPKLVQFGEEEETEE